MVHDLQMVKERIDAIVARNFNNKVVIKVKGYEAELEIESIECRDNITIIKAEEI